jgi:hypothetical protein
MIYSKPMVAIAVAFLQPFMANAVSHLRRASLVASVPSLTLGTTTTTAKRLGRLLLVTINRTAAACDD